LLCACATRGAPRSGAPPGVPVFEHRNRRAETPAATRTAIAAQGVCKCPPARGTKSPARTPGFDVSLMMPTMRPRKRRRAQSCQAPTSSQPADSGRLEVMFLAAPCAGDDPLRVKSPPE